MTGSTPGSCTARCCRLFLRSLLAAATAVLVLPANADNRDTDVSPEGFSASLEGLPQSALDAWHATVLVTSRRLVWPEGKDPRWRTKHGSGVVVRIDEDKNQAVVVIVSA
jgi:hypothetical protein